MDQYFNGELAKRNKVKTRISVSKDAFNKKMNLNWNSMDMQIRTRLVKNGVKFSAIRVSKVDIGEKGIEMNRGEERNRREEKNRIKGFKIQVDRRVTLWF